MATKKKLDAAEKMLASKRRLIKRLREDVAQVREGAAEKVAKIEAKIRVAQTIADALEAGTLKP